MRWMALCFPVRSSIRCAHYARLRFERPAPLCTTRIAADVVLQDPEPFRPFPRIQVRQAASFLRYCRLFREW